MRSLWLLVLAGADAVWGLSGECLVYLNGKGLPGVQDLADQLRSQGYPCNYDAATMTLNQRLYHPDPKPGKAGGADTTPYACTYGHPAFLQGQGTCCGIRPHFNWVMATCEDTGPEGPFCASLPECAKKGSPKINYVAAYQYNDKAAQFMLMDESSVGDISASGIAGDFFAGTGWEKAKDAFRWQGGDWTTKYAPWAKGVDGVDGPRGATPPGALFVMSAENFYYGAFFMLSQLTLNLQGKNYPTGTNCWVWELDPVEGTLGWQPGAPLPGNLNQEYSTADAMTSGCMLVPNTNKQANGLQSEFKVPELFKDYCDKNPTAVGCQPGVENIGWSGGSGFTQRWENLWDEAYVFAVVIDQQGYWIYRWRPEAGTNNTGWPGVGRHTAARTLQARPRPVKEAAGLKTDVPGAVEEAVIFQPGMPSSATCLRASVETVNYQYGAAALGAMANELGQDGPGGTWAGAQNWWDHFADTKQLQGYPLSIAGVSADKLDATYTCSLADSQDWGCGCGQGRCFGGNGTDKCAPTTTTTTTWTGLTTTATTTTKPPPPPCERVPIWSWLASLSVLILFVKRRWDVCVWSHRVSDQRSLCQFNLDSFKQVCGGGLSHLMNLYFAGMVWSTNPHSYGDVCEWFWIQVMLAATLGVIVEYFLLALLVQFCLFFRCSSGASCLVGHCHNAPAGDAETGSPRCSPSSWLSQCAAACRYVVQIFAWLAVVFVAKLSMAWLIVVFASRFQGGASSALALAVAKLGFSKSFVATGLTPLVMGSFQYWWQDNLFVRVARLPRRASRKTLLQYYEEDLYRRFANIHRAESQDLEAIRKLVSEFLNRDPVYAERLLKEFEHEHIGNARTLAKALREEHPDFMRDNFPNLLEDLDEDPDAPGSSRRCSVL